MNMQIRKHVYEAGVKNPEYLINDNIADRKGKVSNHQMGSLQDSIKPSSKVAQL